MLLVKIEEIHFHYITSPFLNREIVGRFYTHSNVERRGKGVMASLTFA